MTYVRRASKNPRLRKSRHPAALPLYGTDFLRTKTSENMQMRVQIRALASLCLRVFFRASQCRYCYLVSLCLHRYGDVGRAATAGIVERSQICRNLSLIWTRTCRIQKKSKATFGDNGRTRDSRTDWMGNINAAKMMPTMFLSLFSLLPYGNQYPKQLDRTRRTRFGSNRRRRWRFRL